MDTPTCLLSLLRACNAQERERLATLAGTDINYLYSLAGGHRAQPRLGLGLAISEASEKLHAETGGRTPIVTPRELADMGAVRGLKSV